MADVDTDPAAIRVVGKGGKQRLVPLSPTVGPLLEKWMELRGDSPGPLFCPIDRRGNLLDLDRHLDLEVPRAA